MKFFFLGIMAGAVINIFVFFSYDAVAMHPEFTVNLNNITAIEASPYIRAGGNTAYVVKMPGSLYLMKENGEISASVPMEGPAGVSGNGEYYIRYEKTGKEVEFFNSRGERFWKLKSLEYPYLSHTGRLVFMLNGDQSGFRILDHNGNEIGIKKVSGRICTVLNFSKLGDFGCAGFLDGSFSVIAGDGSRIYSGRTGNSAMVKSMAVSDNGRFAALHGGDTTADFIEIYDLQKQDRRFFAMPEVHETRTALSVSDEGDTLVLAKKSLIMLNRRARPVFELPIEEKRNGQASVREGREAAFLCYTMHRGGSRFMAVSKSGNIMYSRDFPAESFLDLTLSGDNIFIRGSDNLYCYSLHRSAD
jgi:hypothetical protein